ncbi:MAG: hypothetical protein AAF297_05875 [Planctomycetota bacterium]
MLEGLERGGLCEPGDEGRALVGEAFEGLEGRDELGVVEGGFELFECEVVDVAEVEE